MESNYHRKEGKLTLTEIVLRKERGKCSSSKKHFFSGGYGYSQTGHSLEKFG